MEVETETEPSSTVTQNLVAALEQATLMAKQLSPTTDSSQLLQILTTFHSAHHHLSLFLSHHHHPPPPPPPPQSSIFPTPLPENSVSSAVGGGEENDDEPMLMGDDEDEDEDEDEHESRATVSAAAAVEKVVGRMRECFIQNKRPKRRLSPSAEQRRSFENEGVRGGGGDAMEFDPLGTKLRSLDLIYQFHA